MRRSKDGIGLFMGEEWNIPDDVKNRLSIVANVAKVAIQQLIEALDRERKIGG